MKKICRILEAKDIFPYLRARKLVKQYKKAKRYLLQGHAGQTRFKERNPKGSGHWCFRINKQYRAFGVFDEEGVFFVYEIGDVH